MSDWPGIAKPLFTNFCTFVKITTRAFSDRIWRDNVCVYVCLYGNMEYENNDMRGCKVINKFYQHLKSSLLLHVKAIIKPLGL